MYDGPVEFGVLAARFAKVGYRLSSPIDFGERFADTAGGQAMSTLDVGF